ncbi:MAG TPA: chaperone modulator CbpM, partial [Stellaceae bacterium]|nr:chaperone modulator CbpM [Stellaceae bacterium]
RREDLERWISNDWVKPDRNAGRYVFRQIDVARVRLIQELRDDLKIDEDALSVVLLLLDQLYDQRRRMRELAEAVARIAPDDVRQDLIRHLTKPG